MQGKKQSFDDLEKQLAQDALGKALKDLHGEITKDIQKNKNEFSTEIKKTMEGFKRNLEIHISQEIDKALALRLQVQFQDVSQQVRSNFHEAFSPILENTKNDMKRLHIQGEETLNSWQKMMFQYQALWNRPFFIMFFASILTGTLLSFLSSYYLTRNIRETMQTHENLLVSYKNLALDYFEREKAKNKELEKKKSNTQATNNKKKK